MAIGAKVRRRATAFGTRFRIGPKKIITLLAIVIIIAAMVLLDASVELVSLALIVSIGLGAVAYLVTQGVRTIERAIDRATRSQRTQGVASAGPEHAPGTAGVRPEKRLANTVARLWAGFRGPASRELTTLGLDPAAPAEVRSQAFFAVAQRQYMEREYVDAYRYVELSAAALPIGADAFGRERAALIADIYTDLGEPDKALQSLLDSPAWEVEDVDLQLRLPALQSAKGDALGASETALRAINRALASEGFSPIVPRNTDKPASLDNLRSTVAPRTVRGPLVSVIVPAYNAEREIAIAITSVLEQTWGSLEVLVIDDASNDRTSEVARKLAEQDSRVKVFKLEHNGGAYVARNKGLELAQGEFITVHDADDWSHPEKIAAQARYLIEQRQLVGCTSSLVRVKAGLIPVAPTARPRAARISSNMSSLMLRRQAFERVGPWDPVRGGADSELLDRLRTVYGKNSVGRVARGAPLSLVLASSASLTGSAATGFQSMSTVLGARRQYTIANRAWHQSENFTAELPLNPVGPRKFAAPQVLLTGSTREQLDVVMMSEFGLPGGTTSSNIQEILAQRKAGLSTGLLHHPVYRWKVERPINPKVATHIDGKAVRLLSAGQTIECDTLVIRFPTIAETLVDALPDVKARRVCVIANQSPNRSYGTSPVPAYSLAKSLQSVQEKFGDFELFPIGPRVREAIETHHLHEVPEGRLSATDWVNIIDLDGWRRDSRRQPDGTIRIGRHSRDIADKWPETRDRLLAAYPDASPFEVHVLGGASSAMSLIGHQPENWRVVPFDGVTPRTFLHGLDVYVYFTSSSMVEAFGRGLLEALAVGLPVITSPEFEPLFGDAAIYARPEDVPDIAQSLAQNDATYADQVRRGWRLIAERFSHEAHIERLRS